jgi:hypothetical protein
MRFHFREDTMKDIFNPNDIGEMPGDITLGEARAYMMREPVILELQERGVTLRLRFIDILGVELQDDMTMAQFRQLAEQGLVTVAIDDGEGGMPVFA